MLRELENFTKKTTIIHIIDGKAISKNENQELKINGDSPSLAIEIHSLTAMESRHLFTISRRAVPPKKIALNGEENSYDYESESFILDLEDNKHISTACTVIYGCPSIRKDLSIKADSAISEIEGAARVLLATLPIETIETIAQQIASIGFVGVTHDFFSKASSEPTPSSISGGESQPPVKS
jgi:hypothetical protein